MTAKRLGKKFFKVIGISLGSLLILLTAFHFWFIHHAEDILEALVEAKSNGKIKLEVKKFKFNWFSNKIELVDAVFLTTDSMSTGTSYRFAIKRTKLKVKAVWPIVFQKTVLIDNLSLESPEIVVTMLRSSPRDRARKDSTGSSIPQEMGRVYKSIQDAVQVLQVKKFEIENATFTLINKIRTDQLPVTIGKIDFHIDNLNVDTAKLTGKEKLFFSDNIAFKSRDQNILFPNGRHRLSYRKFRINIEKKIVEFDSCTIAAVKTDSSATGFSVYFDALQMTNIDFDTLYRSEVIKADSVYCINPIFKLEVDLDKRKAGKKAPKLDQIIRQLTGDMFMNFVVVNNASFDIKTLRNGRPSSFTSKGNNFEMQGLRIDNDARRPLRVEKFAMAIRNYENFLRDSTYEMQFDSVLVNDDKIILNDFSFRKLVRGKTVNSFVVPRFQLTGLSWDDLLFERKLTAQRATLFSPVINFTEEPKKNTGQKRRNIFDALADLNTVIMLEDLNIVDGDIDLHLNGGVGMHLENATLSVESRSLLGSSQLSGIRRSVNYLDFTKGIFKVNDMTVLMNDINYTGADSRLKAAHVLVNNSSNTTAAEAKDVTMNEIFINENTGDVSIGKIGWQEAHVNLSEFHSSGAAKKGASFMSLTDINGNNTSISGSIAHKNASAFIEHVGATAFLLKPGENPIIAGLMLSGKDLLFADTVSRISVGTFAINDEKSALFEHISYRNTPGNDTTDIAIPKLSFIPNIQSAINGEIHAGDMIVTQPVIQIHSKLKVSPVEKKEMRLPKGDIDKVFIDQPVIAFSQETEKGTVRIKWDGQQKPGNSIILTQAHTGDSALSAKQLLLSLNSFILETPKGKNFNAGKGEITAMLDDISFQKSKNEKPAWQATLTSLDGKNFLFDSVGKKAGKINIQTVGLKDLAINSSSITKVRTLVQENQKFRLQQITASYVDTVNQFYLFNAGYDKTDKFFTLDSFVYKPWDPQDVFVANHPYQVDYMNVKTGNMHIGPFDIDKYLQDSIVSIGTLKIDDVVFTDFRDKRHPYKAGAVKELMVNRIRKIPFKLSIDTLRMNNVNVTYMELNPKTGQTGTIPITKMTIRVFPIRNYDHAATDSLRIQANACLLDSIWIRLRLRESYIDSLAGFLMTVRIKPVDMRILNPVLAPLASARIRSGHLDTLSMRVGGNEYLAYGEMKMLYDKLKVELLKNGSPKKSGLLTFLANSFIIKDRNTKRTGNVFFIRNRERSALNFLIKLFMSGVTSSIGIKRNGKLMRSYKKELRQRNLPPVDYD